MNGLHAILVTFFIIFFTATAGSAASDEEVIPDVYASSGTLVTLGDSRAINMRCSAILSGDMLSSSRRMSPVWYW